MTSCPSSLPQVIQGYSAREAYDSVPQLHDRGAKVLQNIRKQARKLAAENEAKDEAVAAVALRTRATAKPKAKPMPMPKRLRSDQVDAIAIEKAAKRAKRSAAHKQATNEAAKAREGGRAPCMHIWYTTRTLHAAVACTVHHTHNLYTLRVVDGQYECSSRRIYRVECVWEIIRHIGFVTRRQTEREWRSPARGPPRARRDRIYELVWRKPPFLLSSLARNKPCMWEHLRNTLYALGATAAVLL